MKTILSTSHYNVVENVETGKKAVEFFVTLSDGSPYAVIVPEDQVGRLFVSVQKYFS